MAKMKQYLELLESLQGNHLSSTGRRILPVLVTSVLHRRKPVSSIGVHYQNWATHMHYPLGLCKVAYTLTPC